VSVTDIREQLLNGLSNGYKLDDKSKWEQNPTPRSLAELGKEIKRNAPVGNSIHSKSDLQVGFQSITYKRDEILKLLERSCFRGQYVLAVGHSEWDQSRLDQSTAEKRDLISSSHFCLTCVDDPEKISEHREELRNNNLNSLILHSSDSHKIERLDKTLQWIKADPTFTGLKQVLNEPDARVFVGNTPPNYKPDHKVIRRVTIKNSSNWFASDYSLELNRDLITIIGGRGSGKSALAEAIAYGAGSKDTRPEAFLTKATKHRETITGTVIELEWSDKSSTSFEVGKLKEDKGLVRYLPQGAVEELCSPQHSSELQEQIENVIFQALDDGDKLGASNFHELRKKTLKQYELRKQRLIKKITDANHSIAEIIKLIHGKPNKEKLLNEKTEELKRLDRTLPKLQPEDKKAQDELATLQEQKQHIEDVIAEKQQTLEAVSEVESRVSLFRFTVEEFRDEIAKLVASAGITDTKAFEVAIKEAEISKIIATKRTELKNEISIIKTGSKSAVASLLGLTEDKLLANNLDDLKATIEKTQKETKAFETLKLKYQQQKKTIQSTEANVKSLKSEIKAITDEQIPRKEQLEEERSQYYESYFEVLTNEKTKIEQLYKPLQESLAIGSDTKKQLVFAARVKYDIQSHNNSGLDIIDRTRKGNFRDYVALKKVLEMSWESCEKQGLSGESIIGRLSSIEDKFTHGDGGELSIEDQLRESISIEEFYDWLYEPSHFRIESSLKFDDVELYLLSPGQKGIVLLMLYLAIDQEDNRPLIIDQPEENLDSLSVFHDLIQYFRERKIYRQIIMVTHNANLVVNTDSEQVIIAEYRGKEIPRLRYTSGSLENQAEQIPDIPIEELEDGIIEQVCNILEGGEIAFGNRKRKYQLSDKVNKL
ncbi:MAG: TrlF family AAA-like ATPase, partial [Candidatus Hodarchaeales archaeon]